VRRFGLISIVLHVHQSTVSHVAPEPFVQVLEVI
jgi:hypothetical protein